MPTRSTCTSSGKILESNGQLLRIDVTVVDATGRQWFKREYEQTADTRSYKDQSGQPRDPFQNLYSTLANDMLAYRQQLPVADLENVRRVSELRFATDLAPYAFETYLTQDKKKGTVPGVRVCRRTTIRCWCAWIAFASATTRCSTRSTSTTRCSPRTCREPYTNWRRYSYAELEAEDEAKRSALTRKLLGAAAIVGGLVVGSEANTYAGQAAATGAIFGGAYAVKSGFDKGAEVKMHSDSLKQLGESFQAEVQPMVVEVEGRTLQLKGTAEEQYHEWRRLLKELYENETGLPVQTPAAAADRCARRPRTAAGKAHEFFRHRHIASCWRAGRNCLQDSFWSDAWAQAAAAKSGLRRTASAAASSR